MDTDSIKVPVEYTIITTSDWTQFEIVEGGWWQDLKITYIVGKDRLTKESAFNDSLIYLEKESNDETLVIATVKGYLNIKKEAFLTGIKYKITKGALQSTLITISSNRKNLTPLLNQRSTIWEEENPEFFLSSSENYIRDWAKEKIFIIHGKDRIQPLLLNKFLNKHKIDAIIFDDLTDKGKTIMEQIEQIRNNVSFAFAILTPDDLGCAKEDIEKITSGLKPPAKEALNKVLEILQRRTRQNVLFELGLFIGALGRENVCFLKQKSINDLPSDLDGVLCKYFDKTVEESFDELRDELQIV
jgi:predicted nucleotide-binding protein